MKKTETRIVFKKEEEKERKKKKQQKEDRVEGIKKILEGKGDEEHVKKCLSNLRTRSPLGGPKEEILYITLES